MVDDGQNIEIQDMVPALRVFMIILSNRLLII